MQMTNEDIRPGDHVQVEDQKSGYSGCVLDYIRRDGAWHICRNDTCPKFFTEDADGRVVGAVRVRGVRLYRRWPPIAEFAQALNPAGGALGDSLPFALTSEVSQMNAPRECDLFDERRCLDCGRTIDTGGDSDCVCPDVE